jgi:hypothetical protein
MTESTANETSFFHFNDCAEIPLRPATHWVYQSGRRWVAVAGETKESWFDVSSDAMQIEVIAEFLMKDISDIEGIPAHHTLVFYTAKAEEIRITASAYVALAARTISRKKA